MNMLEIEQLTDKKEGEDEALRNHLNMVMSYAARAYQLDKPGELRLGYAPINVLTDALRGRNCHNGVVSALSQEGVNYYADQGEKVLKWLAEQFGFDLVEKQR